ncbi:unnamed protein product, partial [Effrenium voratum]
MWFVGLCVLRLASPLALLPSEHLSKRPSSNRGRDTLRVAFDCRGAPPPAELLRTRWQGFRGFRGFRQLRDQNRDPNSEVRWRIKGKDHYTMFHIRGFMNGGLNEAAAEAAALTAAKLFRAKLVAKGCIKKRVIDESLTSDVPGVHFSKKSQKWAVQICCDGGLLWGGLCKEKAEAEARCTQLRKALGLPQRVKRTASMAEHATPQFEPRKP